MSVLVLGISHKSAPVSVLEAVALSWDDAAKLAHEVGEADHVNEAAVLTTCNRVEVYADVERFHGSVEAITRLLGERSNASAGDLLPHLYVHYDDGAVSHLFRVSSGLDSMVVGESQILGQVRETLRRAQTGSTAGPALNSLFQQALRVGKRVHAETDIDRAGPSLVASALDVAAERLGGLAGARVVVVGAGSMAALTLATLTARGAGRIVVANRTPAHALRLTSAYDATPVTLDELPERIADADVLVSCTGATGLVVTAETMARRETRADHPLVVLDLALPHDVAPDVARLPGVEVVDLAALAGLVQPQGATEVTAVQDIVEQELAAYLVARRAASVTPTVVALRTMATGVVDAELRRLWTRLPEDRPEVRDEVERAVRRVAEKLLHQPTVRVRELAATDDGVSYATALAELFSLHPDAVEAVTRPEDPR